MSGDFLYFVTVVKFCSDDTANANPVVFDGFYANSLNNITTCTCAINLVSNTISPVTLRYKSDYVISSIQNRSDCDSSVYFIQPSVQERSDKCYIDGSMTLSNTNSTVDIFLIKHQPDGDTSYCIKLEVGMFVFV